MEKITKEGKELETVLASILEENNLTKEEVIYTYQEKKGKLFQGSLIEVTVYPKKNILDEIKIYLTNVDEEYRNLFLTYGHFFNLNFSFTMTLNVYSTKIVKYFVKHIAPKYVSFVHPSFDR